MTQISFITNIGAVTVTAQHGEVVKITIGEGVCLTDGDERDVSVLEDAKKQITEYLSGDRKEFDLKLAEPDTDFAKQVYAALKDVPYGTTVSYAELARRINRNKAARAVGTAMKNNPTPLVVPCHRVVKSDGTLGEYSAGEGAKLKEKLLEMESDNK